MSVQTFMKKFLDLENAFADSVVLKTAHLLVLPRRVKLEVHVALFDITKQLFVREEQLTKHFKSKIDSLDSNRLAKR